VWRSIEAVDYGGKRDILVGYCPVADWDACQFGLFQADGNDIGIKHIAAAGDGLDAVILVLTIV